MLAQLIDSRRALPAGILNVVNGDKEAVDAILDIPISRPSASSRFPRRIAQLYL